MKKTTILLAFIIAASFFTACKDTANVKDKVNKENLEKAATRDVEITKGTASISFDKTTYDFGTVNEGDVVETTFTITNSGKTDLVIVKAQGSCGCTVPTWPKEPIKPGATGEIDVKFNTSGKPGRQSKTVTLTTNTVKGKELLTVRGDVNPKAKK